MADPLPDPVDEILRAALDLCGVYYILDDDDRPVVCRADLWAPWRRAHFDRCIVAKDRDEGPDGGGVEVSTVFWGMDREAGAGASPPLLWESMVFGGPLNGRQWRYPSRAEALAGHQDLCRLVRERR